MQYLVKKYSEIKTIDSKGIIFIDGSEIFFADCTGKRYDSETCVAERNIEATPAYFDFFTSDKTIRIIFGEKGAFSKSKNHKCFVELQMQINELGYSSYDLS